MGGTRGWSGIFVFKTVPRRPGLLTPATGELLVNNRPTFEWNNAAGAASYTIQVDTTNTFVAPLIMSKNVVQPSYTPSIDLPANKTLYWRVRSNSPAGSSTWSVVRSFKTANPPGIPTLLLPANGSSGTDTTPDFDWSNSTLPAGTTFDHYQIQISADSTFTVVDMNQDIAGRTNSAFTPATDLLIGAYSWRVRAFNTLGQYSSWSAVFTFSITP